MLQLFTLETPLVEFSIATADTTLAISPITYGFTYDLLANGDLIATYKSPFNASSKVAEHRTGFEPWDTSGLEAPERLEGWTCHIGQQTKIQLLSDYIETGASYRQIVDYFEHKHPYLLERCEIGDLIEDLAISGQLERLPSAHMVPAELALTAGRVKAWWDADHKTS